MKSLLVLSLLFLPAVAGADASKIDRAPSSATRKLPFDRWQVDARLFVPSKDVAPSSDKATPLPLVRVLTPKLK